MIVVQVLAAVNFSHLWMFEREAHASIFIPFTIILNEKN